MAKIFNLQTTLSLLIGFFANDYLVKNYDYIFLFNVFIIIEICGLITLTALKNNRNVENSNK